MSYIQSRKVFSFAAYSHFDEIFGREFFAGVLKMLVGEIEASVFQAF